MICLKNTFEEKIELNLGLRKSVEGDAICLYWKNETANRCLCSLYTLGFELLKEVLDGLIVEVEAHVLVLDAPVLLLGPGSFFFPSIITSTTPNMRVLALSQLPLSSPLDVLFCSSVFYHTCFHSGLKGAHTQ